MTTARPQHVVILGGGACGMACAQELGRLGLRATVLEREPRVGGLCGTHERDGFRFDFGGHRFITRSREIDGLVRGLAGDALLERTRSSVILNGGERYRYPLELDDVLRKFGPRRGARALGSYLREAARQRVAPRPDRTFRDWVVHRFGEELYQRFFGPYTGKLWGLAPEEISADWAAERITLPSLFDVALRLAGVPRAKVRTYARRYLYPRLGIGQIFERCAAAIEQRGGAIALGAQVTGLVQSGGRIRAVQVRDAAGEREVACDAVVSTLSLPLLARMVGGLSRRTEESAARLRFRAIRLLNVTLDGPPVSPHTWMYVSEPRFVMSRIQEPLHRSPEMAPPGATSLMLEVPCNEGEPLWTMPDAALYERCLADLDALGLRGLRERTRGCFSTYVREGYPVYHLGYRDDRAEVLRHVARTDNLTSVGRQGSFRYLFMDAAMELGLQAARDLAQGRTGGSAASSTAANAASTELTELYEGKVLTA
jgi:protoporphyrinogen oxidase